MDLRRGGIGHPGVRTVATLAVTVGLLVAGTPTAPGAQAAAEPRAKATIAYTTVRGRVAGEKGFAYSFRTPVLKGSTARNRAFVAAKVDAFVAATIRNQKRANASCSGGFLYLRPVKGTTEASVHRGRYVSIVLRWSGVWCDVHMGGVKSWTLDLRTGRAVTLSRFVSNRVAAFDWAVSRRLAGGCLLPRAVYRDVGLPTAPLPAYAAWRVSGTGVKVFLDHGGGFITSVTVPWSQILTPGGSAARTWTHRDVPTRSDLSFVENNRTSVRVQGKAVTVRTCTPAGSCRTYFGVRSGRTAWVHASKDGAAAEVAFPGTKAAARPTRVTFLPAC